MVKLKNILSIFFASTLIFIFVAMPLFEGFLREKRKLDNKKEEFYMQGQYFKQLKEIDVGIENYLPKMDLVNLAISDESVVPSLVYYTEKSAQENGLFFKNLNSVSKNKSKEFSDLKEIEISFSVVGSYPNFKNFIKFLEKSIKIIKIKNISISFDPDNIEKMLLYDIIIKTYYY